MTVTDCHSSLRDGGTMREKQIEQKLIKQVRDAGGICEKWTSGTSGWPDRIIFMMDGKIGLAEVKAPGKVPRPLQVHRHKQLRRLGFKVYVIDDEKQIGGIIDEIQST